MTGLFYILIAADRRLYVHPPCFYWCYALDVMIVVALDQIDDDVACGHDSRNSAVADAGVTTGLVPVVAESVDHTYSSAAAAAAAAADDDDDDDSCSIA